MYKVKAVYDYSSPHEDDLSFKIGQVITVTEEEGDDWYVGEYADDSGATHEGLFPKNFVEKYEPAPPPRPNRAPRQKPIEQPAVEPAPPPPQEVAQPDPEPVQDEEPEVPKPQAPPLQVPPPATATKPAPPPVNESPISPPSASSAKSAEIPQTQAEAPKAKKAPPPVAAKSNAFRDRIAAFNAPAAAPVQPYKAPSGSTTFIKKPFVAPPPSRNAYVPPPVRDTPVVKQYRREEDPEIAERQAQDQEAAERAGLVGHDSGNTNAEEEEAQPTISLKDRIALLQKQQQEQAERAAAALQHKKEKRPPPKKRTESHEGLAEDSEDTGLDRVASGGSKERTSMDHGRPPRSSHDIKSPDSQHRHREPFSDANDADQSGAGETEDAEGESTSVEDDEDRSRRQPPPPPRAAAAPSKEPDVGDEQDVEEDEEEEEEDEMDAETRRKLELRERMAKMSGGMGMPGMFGGMPMGGLPPKKKKASTEKKPEEHEEYASAPRVPMFGMPGMQPVKSPEQEDKRLAVEKEDSMSHSITSAHDPAEVADVEDITPQPMQRTPTGERPPPVPADRRPIAPPVPSGSRPVPPPLPQVVSPGPGSESGDELTDAGANPMSPKTPSAPSAPAIPKRSSYFGSEGHSGDLSDRRASMDRRVPPIPLASPTSPTSARPPPPPPPGLAPTRPGDRTEGETDYEGDYDTDIAPGQSHKDALTSHNKESDMDDSTTMEPTSARSPTSAHGIPPLPPTAPRAVPPPPPHQAPPSRRSTDGPRGAPPPPPVPQTPRSPQQDDDDEYDPFKYSGPAPTVASPPAPRMVPPPPQSQPPPPQNRPPPPMPPSMPPIPQHQAADSSDEDELYSAPAPRKSHDRPPPPPPQAPPHHAAPPPVPQHDRAAPPPPPQERAAPPPPMPMDRPAPPPPSGDSQPRQTGLPLGRKSLDAGRALGGRTSMDSPRPATQDFIASDIDLGRSSHWWTQPRLLPPSLSSRKDVLVDMRESQSGSSVEKVIYVLYIDYSQTIVRAEFSMDNVSDVQLEQSHDAPPQRLRPDQLEDAYEQYGRRIANDVEGKQNTVVGNGTPHSLVEELLKPYQDALPPVSTRAYGALVYANLANASTQSYDEIRPGDIVTFRNAKFQGKTGPMHAKYSAEVGKPDHVGVVVEWDGSKKKVKVWEQGREHKKVKPDSFKMGDLRSGEVRVWRVMSRSWVGWN